MDVLIGMIGVLNIGVQNGMFGMMFMFHIMKKLMSMKLNLIQKKYY